LIPIQICPTLLHSAAQFIIHESNYVVSPSPLYYISPAGVNKVTNVAAKKNPYNTHEDERKPENQNSHNRIKSSLSDSQT